MEELLKKIAKNTEPKESFYIEASGNSTCIRTSFSPLIQLDQTKQYEMALVNLATYYSIPNIDSSNNNFCYSPDNGTSWIDVDIPEGSYELADINEYIQRAMRDNGHYDSENDTYYVSIEPNNNTLKSVLKIGTGYKVDFTTPNSMRVLLGFDKVMYIEGYNESENIVNILSVNSLRITNDVIGSSYINGGTENVIYSFFPNVGPGYKIVQEPKNLIYLPITLNTIGRMETKLVDQNGRQVNLRGEELTIQYHIREA